MVEKLMKVEEVGQMLGLPRTTIYNLICERRIPVIKISKKCVRFDPVVIRKWLADKSQDVNPKPKTPKPSRSSSSPGRQRDVGSCRSSYIDGIVERAKKEVGV